MKLLLSIVFGVFMCCLLPSKGMAADEAKPALFSIISAHYGAGNKWSDVSDKVKAAVVRDDALTIKVTNGNFGDPAWGRRKTLKVAVKYDGNEAAPYNKREIREETYHVTVERDDGGGVSWDSCVGVRDGGADGPGGRAVDGLHQRGRRVG